MGDSVESTTGRESWFARLTKSPRAGTLMGMVGGVCYGAANFTQKLITGSVSPMESNFITFSISEAILVIYLAITKTLPIPARGEYLITTVVAVTQAILLLCIVNSLACIPAFDETVLVDTAPPFTAFIARIWLKRKLTLLDVLILFIALTGVVLVAQPSYLFPNHATTMSEADQIKGTVYALVGSLSLALYACALSKVQYTPASTLTFYSFLLIIVSNLIIGLSTGTMKWVFTPSLGIKYFVSAILYVLNFTIVTAALKIEHPVYVTVAQVCDLPTVLVLQMLVMKEYPNTLAYVGAGLVVMSIFAIGIKDTMINKCCGSSRNADVDPENGDLESEQLISNQGGP